MFLGELAPAAGTAAPDSIAAYWGDWTRGTYTSTRSASARAYLSQLKPQLCAAQAILEGDILREGEILSAFDSLIRQTSVGTHLFASLVANPAATETLLRLVTRAPRLTPMVASAPEVFDALIAQAPSADVMPLEHVTRGFHATRSDRDAEHLQGIQRHTRKHQFLIGARAMLGWMPIADAELAYSRLAFAAVRELVRLAERKFQKPHGRMPGCDWALVALGKFGGFELTATSDLDLMLVYDVVDVAASSDGPKPLLATQYFNLLAKSLIATLGSRTPHGALFDVDFRLRPWGNKGPIATQLTTLRDYLHQESWTYEHMAMTRARVVAGSAGITAAVASTIETALRRSVRRRQVRTDVLEMHALLHTAKPTTNVWDIKHVPGGLIDIEFVAQYLMLRHTNTRQSLVRPATADALRALADARHLGAADRDVLSEALWFFKNLQQALRIACPAGPQPEAMSNALARHLPAMMGENSLRAVEAKLERLQDAVRKTFARLTRR